jgi:dolichol-phosphate mannosyltransferase
VTSLNQAAQSGDTPPANKASSTLRWLKFNAVGAGGIVVQLATLAILKSGFRIDYLSATALSVEAAVIHNFFWHQRFTWADRIETNSWPRFAKFNLTTGLFSIFGNVLLMRAFVGAAHLNYFLASILTIATCSIANFVVSDRFVFQES